MYAERYPDVPEERWAIIENGYDTDIFDEVERKIPAIAKRRSDEPLVLVHSGTLYPSERDPRPFFTALRVLRERSVVGPANLRIVLRATAHDRIYRPILEREGIDDIVELAPGLPYRAALEEMLRADGLLLFQAANCNHQIPAKVYEYLRARKPVVVLTDPTGDTARVVLDAGMGGSIVSLDDPEAISTCIDGFLEAIRGGRAERPLDEVVASTSRRYRTRELAELFEKIAIK
jgi:glycosyltransferase involved in cell wall biosynthesis